MNVDLQTYRNAMAQLSAAVHVITTDGVAGRYGVTASAVCSVTDKPPTIAICINRSSVSNAIIKTNGVLCVNTLCSTHQGIAKVFAGVTRCAPEQRFLEGHWECDVTGAPVLDGALVNLDCKIVDFVEKGTHTVFFAEIVSARYASDPVMVGLVYFCRNYHGIGLSTAHNMQQRGT